MPRPSKRPQLVAAAILVFHERGYARASLAEVAARAEVPVGNLYYYFKTKQALCEAVIDSHLEWLDAWLATLDEHDSPLERLLAYLDGLVEDAGRKALFGCPMFSLVAELNKNEDASAEQAAQMLTTQLSWLRSTLEPVYGRAALRVAEDWLALVAGSYALAQARHDPALLTRRRRHLRARARAEL